MSLTCSDLTEMDAMNVWRHVETCSGKSLNSTYNQNPAKDMFLTSSSKTHYLHFSGWKSSPSGPSKYKLLKLTVLTATYSVKLFSIFSGKYSCNSYVCFRVQCISYLSTPSCLFSSRLANQFILGQGKFNLLTNQSKHKRWFSHFGNFLWYWTEQRSF